MKRSKKIFQDPSLSKTQGLQPQSPSSDTFPQKKNTFFIDAMDTEEGAKQKNLAMAKKKFNMDPKKVRLHQYTGTCGSRLGARYRHVSSYQYYMHYNNQCCGFGWIRINLSCCWIRTYSNTDPYPHPDVKITLIFRKKCQLKYRHKYYFCNLFLFASHKK